MKPENFQVLIPYKDLAALLEVAQQLTVLQGDIRKLQKQLDACYCIITETNNKCLEIERAL